MAKVSVFGLGYIGCVSAACFARDGHEVIGVDINPTKVGLVNDGVPTVREATLEALVRDARATGRLRATTDASEAVRSSSISVVCVGTPSRPSGAIDLSAVTRVVQQIGEALRQQTERHIVVIRSTVLPGTLRSTVIPLLEESSQKKMGRDFDVCACPEFLRTGSAVSDFDSPPFVVIGADSLAAAQEVREVFGRRDAAAHITSFEVAEMLKYACNSFRALKVAFANEVGTVCRAVGVDSHEVMNLFCEDQQLNLSKSYLRPGSAFGGSCLPKDVRALAQRARELEVEAPLLAAASESNRHQIQRAFQLITARGRRRIGVLGLTFKPGTDDLRESPSVALVEQLLGKGYEIALYDPDVVASELIGANREYIEREIPHLWSLMRDTVDDVVANSDVIVVGNGHREYLQVAEKMRPGQTLVDLVRVERPAGSEIEYLGLCW
jgi:GDP-mannose 6-dehydrogenase